MSSNCYDNDTDNSSDESDTEYALDQLVKIRCIAVVNHFVTHVYKEPCRTSFHTGYKFVMEILSGHEVRCHEQFRMEKHIFKKLLAVLKQHYGLSKGKFMPLEEALAMFLITLGHGFSNRMVQERFQHSGETVSRWFGIVLDAICCMAVDIIKPTDPDFRSIPDKIKNDSRYWPYFKDCIGAIDGTHIAVIAPTGKQIPYIGRKGITTQNVMAACDFNMCFTFVWAGWEGAAHDTRIFLEALRRSYLRFPHPPRGKYYLVDSGYPQMQGYLGPFKGERYHLPDFRRGSQPRGMKEIFNHRHSSLRCTIERAFGIWKNRWRIVSQMHSFPFDKQVKIVVASMALHNFIRVHSQTDFEFKPYDDDELLLPSSDEGNHNNLLHEENETSIHEMEMNEERNRIANLLMSRC